MPNPSRSEFTLSLAQAAHVLDMTETQVLDLVRARALGAWLAPKQEVPSSAVVVYRFSPQSIREAASALRMQSSDHTVVEVEIFTRGLRAMLRERRPRERWQEAMETNSPMLGLGRDGQVYAHVRADAVFEFLSTFPGVVDAEGSRAARLRLLSVVKRLLRDVGSLRVRGVRAREDQERTWEWWYRLPHSFWREAGPDAMDLSVFGESLLAPGEREWADVEGPFAAPEEDAPSNFG